MAINTKMVAKASLWKRGFIIAALLTAGMVAENYVGKLTSKITPESVGNYSQVITGIVTAAVIGIAVSMVNAEYGVTAFTVMVGYTLAREFRGYVPA